MASTDLILQEDDQRRFSEVLERLRQEANARLTFLLDKNGQQLCRAGDLDDIDPTSLASLTAGNVAATEGLAQLIGEREFAILFHEGENEHLHINVVGGRSILVVLFDERSSLGLVRLRVKKASAELASILEEVHARAESGRLGAFGGSSPFAEITDDDIDALFG